MEEIFTATLLIPVIHVDAYVNNIGAYNDQQPWEAFKVKAEISNNQVNGEKVINITSTRPIAFYYLGLYQSELINKIYKKV